MANMPDITNKRIDEYKDGITFAQRGCRQYYIDKQGEKVAIVLYAPAYYCKEALKDIKEDFGVDNDFIMTGYFPTKWGLKAVFYKKTLSKGQHGHNNRLHSALQR